MRVKLLIKIKSSPTQRIFENNIHKAGGCRELIGKSVNKCITITSLVFCGIMIHLYAICVFGSIESMALNIDILFPEINLEKHL